MRGALVAGVVLVMIVLGVATAYGADQVPVSASPGTMVFVALADPSSNLTQSTTVYGETTFAYNSTLPLHIFSLSADPVSCTAYRFTVNATGGNPPYAISWLFGDNSTGSQSAQNMTTVVHGYAAPGDYILTVSVHDTPVAPLGPSYEDVKIVTVVNPASECGTQLYVVVGLVAVVAVVGVYAALASRRRREVRQISLPSKPTRISLSGA